MRIRLCALFLFAPLLGRAQDAAVKVSTMLHDDGSRTVTKVDHEEHTSEAESYDSGSRLTQKIVYKLDDDDQPLSGSIYNAAGGLIMTSVYKRDGLNRISEEIDYTPNGAMLRRFVYEFGAGGKVSRIRAFDADGTEMQQSAGKADVKKVPPRRHR